MFGCLFDEIKIYIYIPSPLKNLAFALFWQVPFYNFGAQLLYLVHDNDVIDQTNYMS